MYCSNCGNKIEKGSFCPYCGAQVKDRTLCEAENIKSNPNGGSVGLVPSVPYINGAPNPERSVEIYADPSLPDGLFRGKDGYIRWIIPQRKETLYFYMDEKTVGMTSVEKREDTVGHGLKDLVIGGISLAASCVVRFSDYYNGQDIPWESTGTVGNLSLSVPNIRKIKGNTKKCEIKLREILSNITLVTAPQHYGFILDYVARNAPGAQIK